MKKILHLMAILFAVSLSSYVQSQSISGPSLGTAQEFAVLGSSAVNSVGNTVVYADLGTSPGNTITGFPPGVILGEMLPGGAAAAAAQANVVSAYNALGAFTPTQNLTGQQLGKGFSQTTEAITGTVLQPGVYRFDGNARLSGQLRFDGLGASGSIFVIQVNGDLIIEDGSVMSVRNGAQPNNIFFRVTGNVVDGNGQIAGTPAALKGNVLVQNNITLSSGSTHEGRLFSIGGNISLNNNTLFLPTVLDADLAITKTVNTNVAAIGDIVTYTITVRNQGPGNATGVQVRETLPSQLAFVDFTSSLDGTAANFTYNANTGLFTIGDLAFGQTATINLRARVLATGLSILNRVSVISDQPDPDEDDNEAEVPIDVPADVTDLQVVKTVDKSQANIGDALTYTITIRNAGPNNATGVVVTDLLPLSQINITGQPTTSTGTYNSSNGVWTVGNLAIGQTATLTVNAAITGTGTIVNTAVISGNESDLQPTNNTSTVITVVGTSPVNPGPTADLQVTKAVDKARANVGQTLTYTITARNVGPANATGVTVRDLLPTAFLSITGAPTVTTGSYNSTTGIWTIGNLAVGQVVTMTVTGTITTTGDIINTAVVTGTEVDNRPENNTATVITVVGSGPVIPTQSTDLQVVKAVDKASAIVGDQLTYTITATNNGPVAATGVLVVDVLPTSQVALGAPTVSTGLYNPANGVWTIGNLAAGQTATLTVTGAVTAVGTIVNTAVIRGNESDPQPQNNTSTVITNAGGRVADLAVTKTVDKTRASVGDALTYTITARNNGPANATGVTLTDVLPTGFLNITGAPAVSTGSYNISNGVWTIGNLAAGQVVTMTVTGTITNVGTIVNTATLGGNEVDQQPTNNTSTVITVVTPGNVTPGTMADLQVTKAVDKTRASSGQTLTYTITARNVGPNNATGVTVTDVLPTSQLTIAGQPTVSVGTYNASTGVWTIGNLTAGQTATMTVTGTITVASGNIVNTATITGNEPDERPESNTSTVITVVGGGEPNPATATDLQVVKAVDKATAFVGDQLTYTITATNNGPNAATGVLVVDVLPATQVNLGTPTVSVGTYNASTGVWTVGNLAAGQTATLTVSGPITAAGAIVNTAVIRGNEADPQPANNTSTVITNAGVNPATLAANLSINKTLAGNPEVTLGEQVTFVLRAANAGPAAATGVTVTDVLPQGLTFVSATPSADFNSTTGVWTIGNLAVGQANAKELRITATTTLAGRIANVAVVRGNENDPNNNDNTDTEEVCVRPTAPIVGNAAVCPGSNVTYTITPIAGVTAFEITGLPAGVTRVAGGGNTITLQAAANVAPGTYTLSFIALNPNVNCSNSIPSTATLTVSNPVGAPGAITVSSTTLCSLQPVTFTLAPVTGATSYLWTVPQGWTYLGNATGPFTTTQPTIELIPSTIAGTVSVQAVNNCGPGVSSTTPTLNPGATPATPTLTNNSGPCLGFAFSVVAPEAGVTYTWVAPAGYTITSGQGTPSITLRADIAGATGTISVTATNGAGTCSSGEATIDIDASNIDSQIAVPNIFSPNGDGVNDVWVIKNLLNFPDNDLYVYNRWGNEVYRVRGYRNNWAATGLEEATYFYVLRVRGCDGQEQVYRGYVQVAR